MSCGYHFAKNGFQVEIYEKEQSVGGISKTIKYKGFRFDVGGHRFFTKMDEVNKLWYEILGDEFLTRPRLSRIYYTSNLGSRFAFAKGFIYPSLRYLKCAFKK